MDLSKPLARESFPHTSEKGRIKATIANLAHLFKSYGITCQYDEMLKKQTIATANAEDDNDLSGNAILAEIQSALALNDMPVSCLNLIPSLMKRNIVNPVLAFIQSEPWDGKDRLPTFYESLQVEAKDEGYRDLAVRTWLLQCVAAADSAKSTPIKHATAKFELVLVLQGGQGALKTTWFRSLLPKDMSAYIVDGAHLDPADKDTVKRCISCWICELGELDATFRRADVARLKAFLSSERDNIRLPYDRADSSFMRRTSFGASVNPKTFLVDDTGARRFLPLAISKCRPISHDIQQIWAQVWHLYINGSQWWSSPELERLLIDIHAEHAEDSPVIEMISEAFNVSEPVKRDFLRFEHLTAIQIIRESGIDSPNKTQLQQARAFLEAKGFKNVQSTSNKRGYWITKEIDGL
ncbi:MAG: VapE family protein [Methylobacter sp.]|nr:VapE family protein [Methylobacter sp.]MDP2099124.1 VapE family protein [Methylobacter sp.]MDP2429950.1 VapE family protein [Methylobacter sp.]MDP3054795.1 VapE family protein [Methylobacter sp.]MDP3361221.1 VapE family protein [Methylobacter sp.]